MPPAAQPSKLRNDKFGWVLVAVAAMTWGTDVVLRPHVLAAGFDSVSIVLFEHVAMALIFVPFLYRFRSQLRLTRGEFLGLLFIAVAGSALGTVLLTQAYRLGDPLTATLLQKLQPGFAVLAAHFMLKERQKGLFWIGFAMALVAAYLISFGFTSAFPALPSGKALAALCAVSAALLWGCCTVVGRWTLARLDPIPVTGLRFGIALPILIVWALVGGHIANPSSLVHSAALTPFLLIVLLPDLIGMALYYVGLRKTTASLATLAELAYPVTAMVLAASSLQKFTVGHWVGVGLLLLSLYLIRREDLVEAPAEPAL